MKDISLENIDPVDLVAKLTLYAYALFGCFPNPEFEPVMQFHGTSPEDLAVETFTRFLDPACPSVSWKSDYGSITPEALFGFLKRVLLNDFIDMKRKAMYKKSVYMPLQGEVDGQGNREMGLDDFVAAIDSPEITAIKQERQEQLLASFENEPDLKEMLTVQLDPDGFQAYTNQEMAALVGSTVPEIENRKKRLMNRLLKLQVRASEQPAKGNIRYD